MSTGIITNRVTDPSGTACVGVVVNARLMPGSGFVPATFYELSQLETTTTDSNGDWSLTLEVNSGILPGDSYYQVEELIDTVNGVPTIWSIQVASGTHTLYSSLVSVPPSVSVPSYITQSSGDARYQQIGADPSASGTPTTIGTSTVTGTATTAAPSNHSHTLNPAVVGGGLRLEAGVIQLNTVSVSVVVSGPIQPVGTATITGTSSSAAPSNHQHPLSPAVAGPGLTLAAGILAAAVQGALIQPVGTVTVTGTATTWAADNHAHPLSPAVAGYGLRLDAGVLAVNTVSVTVVVSGPIQPVGTATITGTASTAAPSNHQHPLSPAVVGSGLALAAGVILGPVAGSDTQPVNTGTVTGTSTSWATSNHQHALSPAIVGNDLSLAAGVLSVSPRVPITSGLVQPVGTATITGTATSYAVGNHQHPLSPAIAGLGLNLTAGVLGVTAPVVLGGAQDITAVNTATATGTATTVAASNHQHPLSPSVIGSGLTLAAGVILGPIAGSDTQPTNTATVTGTSTSWATSNHRHPLGPNTVGSGVAIQNAVYVANGLTNSNATTGWLFTITSSNTATATVATGQLQFDPVNVNLNVYQNPTNLQIGPLGAWTAFTATPTPSSGSFTTASGAGAYIKIGRCYIYRYVATITTVGTGTGDVVWTTPWTQASTNALGAGRENGVTGAQLVVYSGGGTTANISGSAPANGKSYSVWGVCEGTT